MEVVCKDTEANGQKSMWFFDKGKYVRQDEKGHVKGSITGQNIPNPDELWRVRCEANGAVYPADSISHPKTGQPIRLKPTEATFRLFEHWQGVQSCQP